eukprot:3895348-Rhodomonas_salina.1
MNTASAKVTDPNHASNLVSADARIPTTPSGPLSRHEEECLEGGHEGEAVLVVAVRAVSDSLLGLPVLEPCSPLPPRQTSGCTLCRSW